MHFFRSNDTTIHYHACGLQSGKPVLTFINSLGTDFRIWQAILPLIENEYAYILHDKRGHGLSDVGTIPYSIADYSRDVSNLLDHLGVKTTIVCGLSIGGLIAQHFVSTWPEAVEALVLCDTAHRIGTPDFWKTRISAVETGGLATIVDAVMERWFTASFRSPENLSYHGYRTMMLRQSASGYAASCAAIRDADYTRETQAIAVPTLCLVGAEDASTPPDLVRSLADLIPASSFRTIMKAGHLPCIEQPEAFAQILREFLHPLNQERASQ